VRELSGLWCHSGWRIRRVHQIVSLQNAYFPFKCSSESDQFSQQKKLYKIYNLTDEESTLLEPAACAIHGLDKLNPPVGIEVLLLGAGPTGLILAQLLKLNGASRVVIAANKGIKMDIAKKINAADEYIELDRKAPEAQWKKLKEDNPYGFDVVVEATGVEKLANESINYVRRGGTLMIYGVYENSALVHWPPSKVSGFIFCNGMFGLLIGIQQDFR
jgi:D-arabinitol dehydrogenase (NADP+)